MIESFTPAVFAGRLGESFRIHPPGSDQTPLVARLVDVAPAPGPGGGGPPVGPRAPGDVARRTPFAVVLRGPHAPVLPQRTYQLRIFLDASYPAIVTDAAAAMQLTLPDGRVHVRPSRRSNMRTIESASTRWPLLFPQYGPGRKHERAIRLEAWQQELVDAFPQELLRGLIHSDGCRIIARQRVGAKTYRYVRYFFSNRSEDIKRLFCEYLDQLGVGWNRPNDTEIQISKATSVARLEDFVGPKR